MSLTFEPLLDTKLRAYRVISPWTDSGQAYRIAHLVFGRTEQARLLASSFMTVVENSKDLSSKRISYGIMTCTGGTDLHVRRRRGVEVRPSEVRAERGLICVCECLG